MAVLHTPSLFRSGVVLRPCRVAVTSVVCVSRYAHAHASCAVRARAHFRCLSTYIHMFWLHYCKGFVEPSSHSSADARDGDLCYVLATFTGYLAGFASRARARETPRVSRAMFTDYARD